MQHRKQILNWSFILCFDCKWKRNLCPPSCHDYYQAPAGTNRVNTVKWSVYFICPTFLFKILQWLPIISWKTPNIWARRVSPSWSYCFSSAGRCSVRQTRVQIPPSLTSQLGNPRQFPCLSKLVSLPEKYWGKIAIFIKDLILKGFDLWQNLAEKDPTQHIKFQTHIIISIKSVHLIFTMDCLKLVILP